MYGVRTFVVQALRCFIGQPFKYHDHQDLHTHPQLITQHPDIFWGLIASFWVGNILLVMLNVH